MPSDFGTALQGFTKMLGAPGDDGVFRYEPSPVDEDLPKPEDDSAEVADWFYTQTDPEIAQAVARRWPRRVPPFRALLPFRNRRSTRLCSIRRCRAVTESPAAESTGSRSSRCLTRCARIS